jgi:hypothetical protein
MKLYCVPSFYKLRFYACLLAVSRASARQAALPYLVRKNSGELALLIAPLPQQPFELAFRSSARVTRKCSTAAVLYHRRATTLPRASRPHQTWAVTAVSEYDPRVSTQTRRFQFKMKTWSFWEQGICFPEQGKDRSLDYNNLRLFTSQNMYRKQINDIESRSSIYREEGANSTMKRLNTSIPGRAICLNIAACLCLCYIRTYLTVAYQGGTISPEPR